MFRVTRYPMISNPESGRVGYRKKYRVAGRVRVPAGHWCEVKGHRVLHIILTLVCCGGLHLFVTGVGRESLEL